MGDNKGAVIVTEPSTGKILAMVSKPDFNPNSLKDIWEDIVIDDENSVLLNRATQGTYAPGSTFKIVTTLEYLKENNNHTEDYTFDCNGRYVSEDDVINCYHKMSHQEVDLEASFAQSCNSSYANIGNSLNIRSFEKTADGLLFNKTLPLELPSAKSRLLLDDDTTKSDMLQYSIGQGDILMTPMHMNLITQAIANDGVLMQPMLLDSVKNKNGIMVKDFKAEKYKTLMNKKEAATLTDFMMEACETGTAKSLKNDFYSVAGKTGSAEFMETSSISHAWFTGFAPADNPKICITVIVEEGGSGSKVAVPVAKKIMDVYFEALAN